MRNNAEQALWLCQGKCLYIEHTCSWLFLSQLLVSISIYCTFVPENTCLFLWWFSSSAFHWPYYSPHSNSCWFVQHKATTMLATLLQSCLTLYELWEDTNTQSITPTWWEHAKMMIELLIIYRHDWSKALFCVLPFFGEMSFLLLLLLISFC